MTETTRALAALTFDEVFAVDAKFCARPGRTPFEGPKPTLRKGRVLCNVEIRRASTRASGPTPTASPVP